MAWRARRRRRRVGVAVAMAAAVVGLATVAVALPQRAAEQRAGGGAPEQAAAPSPQTSAEEQTTPANGGFDRGMTGWVATAGAVVSWQTSGHVGGSALVRSNPGTPPGTSSAAPDATVTGLVAKNAAPPAGAGVALQGTAWVRGSAAGAVVMVRLVERSGDGEVAAGRQEIRLTGEEWQKVTVAHTVTRDDAEIDLEVLAVNLPQGTSVGIDSASVTVAS